MLDPGVHYIFNGFYAGALSFFSFPFLAITSTHSVSTPSQWMVSTQVSSLSLSPSPFLPLSPFLHYLRSLNQHAHPHTQSTLLLNGLYFHVYFYCYVGVLKRPDGRKQWTLVTGVFDRDEQSVKDLLLSHEASDSNVAKLKVSPSLVTRPLICNMTTSLRTRLCHY